MCDREREIVCVRERERERERLCERESKMDLKKLNTLHKLV